MAYEFVLYSKEGQVAYITLNRPDRLNAVSPELVRDWLAAITEAEEDDDVKVIVFKGAGRAFSAGADLTGCRLRLRHEGAEAGGERGHEADPAEGEAQLRQEPFSRFSQKGAFLQEADRRANA